MASGFGNPSLGTDHLQRSNSHMHPSSTSMYYSSDVRPYRDEMLIPILYSSDQHQTSAPVKMRILVKPPPSSVPTTRRIYSGTDHRYVPQRSCVGVS